MSADDELELPLLHRDSTMGGGEGVTAGEDAGAAEVEVGVQSGDGRNQGVFVLEGFATPNDTFLKTDDVIDAPYLYGHIYKWLTL